MKKKVQKYIVSILIVMILFSGKSVGTRGSSMEFSPELLIDGFQISTNIILNNKDVGVGVRTVYSIGENMDELETFGLIYGLENEENKYAALTVESKSPYVKTISATAAGKVRESDGKKVYAMIMPVYSGLAQEYYVRPYAIRKDGKVLYGHAKCFSAYLVAEYLYENGLERNKERHQNLYNEVLQPVNPDYVQKEYEDVIGEGVLQQQPVYYEHFQEALADVNAGMVRQEEEIENAEVAVWQEEVPRMQLMRNISISEECSFSKNVRLDCNEYTITCNAGVGMNFKKNLSIENGTILFQNVEHGIWDVAGEGCELTMSQVQILCENTETTQTLEGIRAENANLNKVEIDCRGRSTSRAIRIKKGSAIIKNSCIRVSSESDNGFGVIAENAGTLQCDNVSIQVSAANWAMGIFFDSQTEGKISRNKVQCVGKKNNVPIYIKEKVEVEVDDGTYWSKPISQNGSDSYGTAIYNLGSVTVFKGTFSGGNSGIQCGNGSVTKIYDGLFQSPNHGGIYAACGSRGLCRIDGGTFRCNRGDYTEEELGNIVSYGAGYFGCSGESESWSVNIRNAFFENRFGSAIVQKSNDNYVPASLNIYDTKIVAKDAAIWIQNNESVDRYNANVTIYEPCQITGILRDDREKVTGKSKIGFFY